MDFLEKDLERIIMEHENDVLEERGLPILGKKISQLKIGSYGRSDIITYYRYDGCLYIKVWELKKGSINMDTVIQCARYATGINRYLRDRSLTFSVSCGCVGRSLDLNSEFCYLIKYLDMDIYTYNFDLEGMTFEEISRNSFRLNNEGFKL